MDAIEKRARELLIAEFKARGQLLYAFNIERGGLSSMYAAEIAAIAKALTPPEGYVLVPAVGLRKIVERHATYGGEGYAHDESAEIAAAMLAARPEVHNVND